MSVKNALEIFHAAIAAVQPANLLPLHVSMDEEMIRIGQQEFERANLNRVFIIGAGKASAAMALAIEHLLLPVITDGIIITKYAHALPLVKIRCMEAGHPVPDKAGLAATTALKEMITGLSEQDLVICLVSGGASALMIDVPGGIELAEVQELVKLLLASGASIDEINTVRKHLSQIKGGQLSRLVAPAKLVSLILSDVNGDDLSVIASGPTVADQSSFGDALAVLEKYELINRVAVAIAKWLKDGVKGNNPETPKPGDPVFINTTNLLIGTNRVSLEAAEARARESGYEPVVINSRLEGEAAGQAALFVDACLLYNGNRPACLLMGGETTVTISGNGLGGRNQHFVLAALDALQQRGGSGPVILSGGTDGSDGPTDAAGAVIDGGSIVWQDAKLFLENNDAYHFFESNGGLIKTGPTQTNVMDIVIGLVT